MGEVGVWIVSILGVVIGSGGLIGWYKAVQEKRRGVRESDLSENVAISDQWKAIIETQSKSLLEPLTDRVATLQAELIVVQGEVRALKKERVAWELREELFWEWTGLLVEHIRLGKPPPAPERPEGLRVRRSDLVQD